MKKMHLLNITLIVGVVHVRSVVIPYLLKNTAWRYVITVDNDMIASKKNSSDQWYWCKYCLNVVKLGHKCITLRKRKN